MSEKSARGATHARSESQCPNPSQAQAAAQLNATGRRSSTPQTNGSSNRCLIAVIVYLALLLDNMLLTVIGNGPNQLRDKSGNKTIIIACLQCPSCRITWPAWSPRSPLPRSCSVWMTQQRPRSWPIGVGSPRPVSFISPSIPYPANRWSISPCSS